MTAASRPLTPNLPLTLLIFVLVGLVAGTATWLGLGSAALFASITALYIAMSAFGGTLRTDLSVFGLLGAGLGLFAVVPALLRASWPLPASALMLLGLFVAALVPALGQRYAAPGRSLGLVTLYAYAYPFVASVTGIQVALAITLALGLLLTVRVLTGLPDPNGPLRRVVAGVLSEASPGAANAAVSAWLTGGFPAWLGLALLGSLQYRTAQRRLERVSLPELDTFRPQLALAAQALSARVAPAHPERAVPLPDLEVLRAQTLRFPPPVRHSAHQALDGLALTTQAATHRDLTPTRRTRSWRGAFARTALRGTLSLHSAHTRHALRSVLAVALALGAVAWLHPGPFTLALLTTTYGVLFPSWRDSVTQVRQNVMGLSIGAGLSAMALGFLPPDIIKYVAFGALLVGVTFVTTSSLIFNAALMVMLAGLVAPSLHLSASAYAAQQLAYAAGGGLLGILIGFILVPPIAVTVRQHLLQGAVADTAALLRRLATPGPLPEVQAQLIRAVQAQQNARPVMTKLRETDVPNRQLAVATALETLQLAALATLLSGRRGDLAEPLALASRVLTGEAPPIEADLLAPGVDLLGDVLLFEATEIRTLLADEAITSPFS